MFHVEKAQVQVLNLQVLIQIPIPALNYKCKY